LTFLVYLPFLAVILPFQVPAALCRGRGRLAFWILTFQYHTLLWTLAVSVLDIEPVPAALFLLFGCVAYGRPLELDSGQIEGAGGIREGMENRD
jgi:hypothetical protein